MGHFRSGLAGDATGMITLQFAHGPVGLRARRAAGIIAGANILDAIAWVPT
jgi:hypothetical protein